MLGKPRGYFIAYSGILLLLSSFALAHHSVRPGTFQKELAEFDATVAEFRFSNPHARLEYDIKSAEGQVERWATITHSVNVLRRRGIDKDILLPGDKVKVFGWPSIKDKNFMRIKEVHLADQRVVRFWGREMGVYAASEVQGVEKDIRSAARVQKAYDFSGGAPQNFSGLWERAYFGKRPPPPPFNAKATALIAEFDPKTDDPVLSCAPGGYPREAGNPYPIEIIHHPDVIYVIHEAGNVIRRVYLDGRDVPDGIPDSKVGYATAAWKGDELVISTKKLQSNILNGFGWPISDKAVVTERWRYVDPKSYTDAGSAVSRASGKTHQKLLRSETYIDDPEYYTQPFLFKRSFYSYKPDLVLLEYLCDPQNATSR